MKNVALAAGTLLLIVLIERFGPPVLARISILLGIVIGTLVAIPMGMVHWDKVPNANWVGVTTPFYFGFPIFEISAIVSMCIVGLVIMTETTGDILAIGQIVDVKVDQRRLADGLRADGCPPFSAASSTRSRTPPSRRTSAWCRSPGSAAGTSPPSPAAC